jgi:hypothetical protein
VNVVVEKELLVNLEMDSSSRFVQLEASLEIEGATGVCQVTRTISKHVSGQFKEDAERREG